MSSDQPLRSVSWRSHRNSLLSPRRLRQLLRNPNRCIKVHKISSSREIESTTEFISLSDLFEGDVHPSDIDRLCMKESSSGVHIIPRRGVATFLVPQIRGLLTPSHLWLVLLEETDTNNDSMLDTIAMALRPTQEEEYRIPFQIRAYEVIIETCILNKEQEFKSMEEHKLTNDILRVIRETRSIPVEDIKPFLNAEKQTIELLENVISIHRKLDDLLGKKKRKEML